MGSANVPGYHRAMPEAAALCPDCRTACSLADNYCRECGTFLGTGQQTSLTTHSSSRTLSIVRPSVSAPVKRMATAVVVGSALRIGVGLAGKYLASQGGQKATRAVALPKQGRATVTEPITTAISETVVIRRVWLRRG